MYHAPCTSPSIPPNTYTSLPYPVSPELAFIVVDITLSSHPLSSPTLPSIGDTILYLVPELCAFPAMRPHAPCIRRVLHPSALSAPLTPSSPFEIPRDPIDQLAVYSRRHPKRNINIPSCGTHLYMLIFLYIDICIQFFFIYLYDLVYARRS